MHTHHHKAGPRAESPDLRAGRAMPSRFQSQRSASRGEAAGGHLGAPQCASPREGLRRTRACGHGEEVRMLGSWFSHSTPQPLPRPHLWLDGSHTGPPGPGHS